MATDNNPSRAYSPLDDHITQSTDKTDGWVVHWIFEIIFVYFRSCHILAKRLLNEERSGAVKLINKVEDISRGKSFKKKQTMVIHTFVRLP